MRLYGLLRGFCRRKISRCGFGPDVIDPALGGGVRVLHRLVGLVVDFGADGRV